MKGSKPSGPQRAKLTLTIDPQVIRTAKRAADSKGIPLSRLIENYLTFVSDPKLYCFKCGVAFASSKSSLCAKCGWIKCAACSACGCVLGAEAAQVAHYMRRVYEDLLSGRLK